MPEIARRCMIQYLTVLPIVVLWWVYLRCSMIQKSPCSTYINQLFTSCLKKRTLGILLLQVRTTPSYFLSNIQMTELLIKQTDIKVTSSTTLRNNRVFHVLRQHDAAVVGAKRRGSLLTDDSSIKMLNNLIFASLLQQRGRYFWYSLF